MIYFKIYLIVSLVTLLFLFNLSRNAYDLLIEKYSATDWIFHLLAAFIPILGIVILIAEHRPHEAICQFLVKERLFKIDGEPRYDE